MAVKVVEVGDSVYYTAYHGDPEQSVGEERMVKIVEGQSDSSSGTVNQQTPLAQALLDSAEGDLIEFLSPSGKQILRINLIG